METRHLERSGKLVAALCVMVLIVPLVFCIPLIVADLSHTHDTNSRPYTLFFPDIIAGKDWKTTISVANPSSKEASISEAFFAAKGEFLESLSASLRLGPGESRQIESKRLPAEASWLKVAASGPVLGRLSVASSDGKKSESVPVTGRTSRVSDFPLLLQDGVKHKALALLNPSEGSAGMEIIALDENGAELAREALPELPSMENVRVLVSDVFKDDTVLENVATFRVVSDREIAGMQIENPPDTDLIGMPALTRTGAEWFLPVIKKASGAELYTTAYVFNSGKSSATVAMEAFDISQSSLGVFDRTVLLPGAIHAVSSSNLDGIIPAGADLLRISGSGDIAVYEVIGLVEGTGRTAIMGLFSRVRALAGTDVTFSADKGALTAVSKPASPNEISRKPGELADGKNSDSKNKTGLTALNPHKATAARVDACGEIATDSVWSSANLYVVTCDVIVASGATLTIQPGTTVKLVNGTWSGTQVDIIVKGGLIANGTAGAPIVFTSYADDTKGGDTNGDEANSSPAACDWGSLFFAAGSHGSFSNAYIAYGGGGGYIGLDLGLYTSGMVESRTSDLALDSTTLHKSGRAGLYAAGASVNVTNSTISANAYNGLHYEGLDPGRPLTVSDNVFKDGNGASGDWSTVFAGAVVLDGNPSRITFQRNTATGNVSNNFGVRGYIKSDLTWENTSSIPLLVHGVDRDLIVNQGATLTLTPGTIMKFGVGAISSMLHDLIVRGSLIAEGTAELPIVFTSQRDDSHGGDSNNDGAATTPAAGDWGAIVFAGGSHGSISNAFIGYGGAGGYVGYDMGFYVSGMIHSFSSGVDLDLVTIHGSAQHGLYAQNATVDVTHGTVTGNLYNGLHYAGLDAAAPLTIADNVFKDGNGAHRSWDAQYAGSIVVSGNTPQISILRNTATGNAVNGFAMRGLISGDMLWGNADKMALTIPQVDADFIVGTGATLTLEPGAIVKLGSGVWSGMANDLIVLGSLQAEGTEALPIAFTSLNDDTHGGDTNGDSTASAPARGDWGCILFRPGSTAKISNAFVGYGGTVGYIAGDMGFYSTGMIMSQSSGVSLDLSTIQSSATYGLYAKDASNNVTNSKIAANFYNGLHYEGLDPAKPLTVANNVFSDGNGSSKGWDTAYAGSVVLNGNPPKITFKKNTASGNATNAFGVRGLITSDLTWENTNSIPLLVHGVDRDLIVGTGATLTLSPGTIMKFGVGVWSGMLHDLIVKGSLIAEGTTAAPIVFTSVADDSSGGDTNNDGSDTSPISGDWGCILFASGSHGRASNATMKYGGSIGYIGTDIGIYNGGMVHSLSSDVVLDHVSIKNAANNGLLAVNAGVINRNGTIAKNAFGVATNNGSNYWVDARSCYWGDASGPYHSVKNPGGKGDKVGENVLFYPWAEDPTGTLTQQIRMQILGPGRISPGDLAEYVISFTTGRAIKGAVLVASLPETAEYLESSDGGSYMHESHQVYWKLGDLKQYQEGLYRVKTRFMWGIPNDFEDGVSAIMSGKDTDLGGYTFNIARYKNYVPIGVISSTIMGDAAVEAELNAHADMKTLHDNAVADGFTRVGGAQAGFDSQTFTLIEMASRVKGAKAEIRRNHSDGSITAHFFYPSLYVVKDVNGGMTLNLDLDTVEFTGTWTAATAMDLLSGDEDDSGDESDADDSILAETYGPMTASEDEAEILDWPDYSPEAAITKGVAFRNCILMQIPKWTIKKISAIVKTTLNAKDCAKALYNLDPADMLPCMQMFKQVGETVPFVGEMKMLHKCYWDVVIGGQLEKYACSAEKPLYKVEPPTLSLSDPKSWFGRWQRASYVKYECDPTTQMWKFAGTLYCDTGYIAQDGASDSDGRPCVPANEDWAFVNEELYQKPGDKKVPSRSVKTVARQARDPNEKFGPPGNVIAGQQMDYRITYENEGAGIAYGVFILDQLNDAIDDTTLQIGDNAEYLARSRTIMWDVGELQPKGETGSKGEVSFSAKLKSDLKNGTTVSNRAVVFFPSVPEETPTNPVINVVRSLSALPQSVTAFSGQSLNIVLQGQDAGGATLTYKIVDKPLNGSLTGTPPNVVYKSTANFTGGDRFSFAVSNGATQSEAADVSVTVEPSPTDTTPPKVAWTSPYKDEVVKQAGTKPAYNDSVGPVYLPTLVLEFSEIVDPATVNDQTVHLVDGTGREVAATVAYDTQSGRATVTVREPWKSGVYTATVGIGVADQNGNHMTSEYSWSFKAVAATRLPTVTIKAKDAAASEPGINKGKFKVIRKGNRKQPLTVEYSISGTAAPGKDYKKLSGKVTIPKRKSSAAIVVAPLDDQLDETAETVILKLLKSPGYKVGKPGEATIKIKDND
jgi:hypothetical protein